jgi:hypothetical protein
MSIAEATRILPRSPCIVWKFNSQSHATQIDIETPEGNRKYDVHELIFDMTIKRSEARVDQKRQECGYYRLCCASFNGVRCVNPFHVFFTPRVNEFAKKRALGIDHDARIMLQTYGTVDRVLVAERMARFSQQIEAVYPLPDAIPLPGISAICDDTAGIVRMLQELGQEKAKRFGYFDDRARSLKRETGCFGVDSWMPGGRMPNTKNSPMFNYRRVHPVLFFVVVVQSETPLCAKVLAAMADQKANMINSPLVSEFPQSCSKHGTAHCLNPLHR